MAAGLLSAFLRMWLPLPQLDRPLLRSRIPADSAHRSPL